MIHPIVIDSCGGEYMEQVLVLEWKRAVGQRIEAGETIAVVETAKAATEVAAPHGGYLREIFFAVGTEAPVGAQLGTISETQDEAATGAASSQTVEEREFSWQPAPNRPNPGKTRIVASPLARRIARDQGVDLTALKGTGPSGGIKLRDVGSATVGKSPSRGQEQTTLVLLHGFGADRSAWRLVAPLIDGRLRLIMPELPGHGDAPEIPSAGLHDMAIAISDGLQAAGIEDAHVFGHSLGGAVALLLSRIGKLRIRSLGLIAPLGLGSEIDVEFLNGFASAGTPDELQPWLLRMVANPASVPSGFAQAVMRQRSKRNLQAVQPGLIKTLFPRGEQSVRLAADLDAIKVPVKVIWGLKDQIIPSQHVFAAPGSAALHLLRDTGHTPQLECPEILARLIGELVRSGH